MAQTIYASFNTIEQAEKAAGALLDHGVLKEDLSLVSGGVDKTDGATEYRVSEPDPYYPQSPEIVYGIAPAVPPAQFIPEGPGTVTPGMVYVPAADEEYDGRTTDRYDAAASYNTTMSEDEAKAESTAKSGISTTTPEDAGAGAIKGTGVGLGIGILAGLAALVVPGVGLVLGGGALAAALGAAALTTASGAAVGGVTGYLKDQGVDEVHAFRYQESLGAGGALIALSLPSNGIGLQESEAVLNKYGANDITSY